MQKLMVLLVASLQLCAGDVQTMFRFYEPKDLAEALVKQLAARCPEFEEEERSEVAVALSRKYGGHYIDEQHFLAQSFASYVPSRLSWLAADEFPELAVRARLESIRNHGARIRDSMAACGILMTIVKKKGKSYVVVPPAQ